MQSRNEYHTSAVHLESAETRNQSVEFCLGVDQSVQFGIGVDQSVGVEESVQFGIGVAQSVEFSIIFEESVKFGIVVEESVEFSIPVNLPATDVVGCYGSKYFSSYSRVDEWRCWGLH